MPPDREKLERRLRNRGLDSEEVICRRLVTASREIENYAKYDYILVNDLLDQSTEDLKAVVLAERLGPSEKKMPTEAEKQLLGTAETIPTGKSSRASSADCGVFHDAGKAGMFVNKYRGKTNMKLIEGFDSNYRYILVAARRARQLQSGAPPVVETASRKPCRIADEIKAGKVKWLIPETPRAAVELASELLETKGTTPDA